MPGRRRSARFLPPAGHAFPAYRTFGSMRGFSGGKNDAAIAASCEKSICRKTAQARRRVANRGGGELMREMNQGRGRARGRGARRLQRGELRGAGGLPGARPRGARGPLEARRQERSPRPGDHLARARTVAGRPQARARGRGFAQARPTRVSPPVLEGPGGDARLARRV